MKSTIIAFAIFAAAFGAPVRRQTGDLQTFTGALGGIVATPVTDSGNPDRPFEVKGDTFVNIGAALTRSCDQQFNACANATNGGDATLSVPQCLTQKDQCNASAQGNAQAGSANAGNANANGNNSGGNTSNINGGSTATGTATSCT